MTTRIKGTVAAVAVVVAAGVATRTDRGRRLTGAAAERARRLRPGNGNGGSHSAR